MKTYTNKKTGAVVETESVVNGENWVLTADSAKKKRKPADPEKSEGKTDESEES